MRLALDDMPVTRYTDISVNIEEQNQIDAECFFEPSFTVDSIHLTDGRLVNTSHCQGCTTTPTRVPLSLCYRTDGPGNHCNNCECINFSSFLADEGRGSHALIDIIKFEYLKTAKGA